MRTNWLKRSAGIVAAGVIVAGAAWFAWPRPVPVDLAVVGRGIVEVTVDEEAKTRVRHIYTVSAPIGGKVLRISHPFGMQGNSVHVGDQVTADQTIVALMQPMLPSFVDVRSREELQAAVAAADAGIAQAEADIRKIQAALEFARTELRRAESLARSQTISAQAFDKARFEVDSSEAALLSAKAQLDVRRAVRVSLAARLIDPASVVAPAGNDCCVQIRAPVTGRVLKIVQDSEAVVQPGAPLVEIGDPLDLEIVAELLTTDAVRIQQGVAVRIEGWGGPLVRARVTRVEPAGFLKVSALGIEEQRVRVIIDFTDPPAAWSRLGHDFRVIVHVSVSRADNALNVPVAALFRQRDQWAVFAVKDGRALVRPVEIGQRNSRVAEVLSGLAEGERVVLHPSDRVRDGTAVEQREIH